MTTETLGFRVANLLLPGDPKQFAVNVPADVWEFEREPHYDQSKVSILEGKIAGTYSITYEVE